MSHNQQCLNRKCLKTENFVTDNVFFDKNRKCLTTNTVSTASVGTDSVFLLKMSCNRQCLFTTYLILSLLTLSCNRNYLVLDFRTQLRVSARRNNHATLAYLRLLIIFFCVFLKKKFSVNFYILISRNRYKIRRWFCLFLT